MLIPSQAPNKAFITSIYQAIETNKLIWRHNDISHSMCLSLVDVISDIKL